jgi:hypothetical protein
MTTTTAPQLIEAELGHVEPLGSDAPLDPLAQALRQRGFRSVSIGLRTAQIDDMLYELCPVSQATLAAWLDGDPLTGPRTVRLARRSLAPGPKGARSER